MANGLKKESTVMIKAFFLWDMGPNKWEAFESFFYCFRSFFFCVNTKLLWFWKNDMH